MRRGAAQPALAGPSGIPRHATPAAVATEGRASAHGVADDMVKIKRGGMFEIKFIKNNNIFVRHFCHIINFVV